MAAAGFAIATGLQVASALAGQRAAKKQSEIAQSFNNMAAAFEMQNTMFNQLQNQQAGLERRFNLSRQAMISKANLQTAMSTTGIVGQTPTQLLRQADSQFQYNKALLSQSERKSAAFASQQVAGIATRAYRQNQVTQSQVPTIQEIGLNLVLNNPWVQQQISSL